MVNPLFFIVCGRFFVTAKEYAKTKYDKENTVRYSVKLNKNTDREIIAQVERMTGREIDPKTKQPWTTHGAIRHLLYMAVLEQPEVLTLLREARKLSPEQLQAVIELVERINAGEKVQEILMVEE